MFVRNRFRWFTHLVRNCFRWPLADICICSRSVVVGRFRHSGTDWNHNDELRETGSTCNGVAFCVRLNTTANLHVRTSVGLTSLNNIIKEFSLVHCLWWSIQTLETSTSGRRSLIYRITTKKKIIIAILCPCAV